MKKNDQNQKSNFIDINQISNYPPYQNQNQNQNQNINNINNQRVLPLGIDLKNFLPQQQQQIEVQPPKPQAISTDNDLPVISKCTLESANFKAIIANRVSNLKKVSQCWSRHQIN